MTTKQNLATAVSLLTTYTQASEQPADNRVDVVLNVADLVTAVHTLIEANWGYLAAITGLDLGVEAGQLEVLYHFCAGAAVVTLRVKIDRHEAIIPTICTLIPSASFFERELGEMLGITIADAPNTDRLFLPDEWPEGVYPLRKDYV
ncbi:MAG: NADH-quinone oxidoreductase subunit C [Ardenticatenaceae bacterium]|nr:NADH-quinone oxidoreductase subunit C [Ardenticatenaceae bacterium]